MADGIWQGGERERGCGHDETRRLLNYAQISSALEKQLIASLNPEEKASVFHLLCLMQTFTNIALGTRFWLER